MIEVLSAGLFTSIQDLGRFGYRNQGVPNSGCMDRISAVLANLIVNNSENCAVLEVTLVGPKLKFHCDTLIAIAGAEMRPKLNSNLISNNKLIKIKKGDILSFGKVKNGTRSYIAVRNGVQSEKILNSRSQYFPITAKSNISKGEKIPVDFFPDTYVSTNALIKNNFFDTKLIKVTKGPDFDLFSEDELIHLFGNMFSISNNNNRMGYQINETVLKHSISMLTSPVIPGTVQLLPSGKIVVLMNDGQTTGGYPRILQLLEHSISVLSQKKVGDAFKFELSPTINLT